MSRIDRRNLFDPSEAQNRAAQCDGKQPLTWAQASEILKRETSRDKKRGAYHCPFCRAWHVGRHPKRRMKPWRIL